MYLNCDQSELNDYKNWRSQEIMKLNARSMRESFMAEIKIEAWEEKQKCPLWIQRFSNLDFKGLFKFQFIKLNQNF